MSKNLVLAAAIAAVACRGPTFGEVAEACGDGAGQVALPSGVEGSYHTISQECATRLGEAYGVTWSTFNEEPHSFDIPETTGEHLVTALFTLVMAESGSVASVMERAREFSAMEQTLAEVGAQAGLESDDSFREGWYRYTTDRIEEIRFDPYEDVAIMKVQPAYSRILRVPELTEPFGPGTFHPASYLAGTIVHESRHDEGYFHEQCPNLVQPDGAKYCDQQADGAHGFKALWLNQWVWSNHDRVPLSDLYGGLGSIATPCGYIFEADSFSPCTETIGELEEAWGWSEGE